jgi:hypothetical protein
MGCRPRRQRPEALVVIRRGRDRQLPVGAAAQSAARPAGLAARRFPTGVHRRARRHTAGTAGAYPADPRRRALTGRPAGPARRAVVHPGQTRHRPARALQPVRSAADGAGEPALGIHATAGRAAQARPPSRRLDDPPDPPAPPDPTGSVTGTDTSWRQFLRTQPAACSRYLRPEAGSPGRGHPGERSRRRSRAMSRAIRIRFANTRRSPSADQLGSTVGSPVT